MDEVTYRPLRSVGRAAVGAASILGPLAEVGLVENSELGLVQIPGALDRSWSSCLAPLNGPELSGPWSSYCSGQCLLPTPQQSREASGGMVVCLALDVPLEHPIPQKEGGLCV